jgi:putative Ca2+/H+ antiporter (TMEM165/GDT1 family)
MDSFLLCLILTFAIAVGGREQLIIAQFSESLERSSPLLATGVFCAVLSACVMAYAGASIAAILPSRAADMLVAFALAAAALELAWPVKIKPMKEPTRSYIAIGAVVCARQIGDAARFVIFAFAAQAVYPTTALIGGAIGGAAAAGLGWSLGLSRMQRFPLRYYRMALAVCTFLAALVIGLNARYTFL